MFVRDLGAGPVVLVLHGTPSPAEDWRPLAEALAPRYRVLLPDLPGYGATPAPADANVEKVGDAIAAMLRERGVQELHGLVGYSSGAYRAFDLALRHVAPRVIVSLAGMAAFDDDARASRRGFAALLRADPAAIAGPVIVGAMAPLMLSAARRQSHPDDAARVERWLKLTTAPALAAELEGLVGARDLTADLRALTCDVVCRVGADDVGAPPAWSEAIVNAVAHGALQVVPGVGHALAVEDLPGTIASITVALERRR